MSSSHLDSSAGVSVNKWEAKNCDKYGAGRGKSKWQSKIDKNGSGEEQRGQAAQVAGQANAGYQLQEAHPENQQTLRHQAKSKRNLANKCQACFKCRQFSH